MTTKDKHLIKKYLINKGYVEAFDIYTCRCYRYIEYKEPHFVIVDDDGYFIKLNKSQFIPIITFHSFDEVVSVVK